MFYSSLAENSFLSGAYVFYSFDEAKEFFVRRYIAMVKGRYGIHGGQFVPEVLMNAVHELEEAYEAMQKVSI